MGDAPGFAATPRIDRASEPLGVGNFDRRGDHTLEQKARLDCWWVVADALAPVTTGSHPRFRLGKALPPQLPQGVRSRRQRDAMSSRNLSRRGQRVAWTQLPGLHLGPQQRGGPEVSRLGRGRPRLHDIPACTGTDGSLSCLRMVCIGRDLAQFVTFFPSIIAAPSKRLRTSYASIAYDVLTPGGWRHDEDQTTHRSHLRGQHRRPRPRLLASPRGPRTDHRRMRPRGCAGEARPSDFGGRCIARSSSEWSSGRLSRSGKPTSASMPCWARTAA